MLNKRLLIITLAVVLISTSIITSCKKVDSSSKNILLPVIETSVVIEVTSDSTASSGGTISSEGSSIVKERGVCWSTERNPTIANSRSIDGAGAGVYNSLIIGLQPFTQYYVRAYATNNEGTAYGTEKTITTKISAGRYYKGGIVYRLGKDGEIYICAENDQSNDMIFGKAKRSYTTQFPDLIAKTDTIIANTAETSAIAASLCKNLILNGYDDWVLPSSGDLDSMYTYLAKKGIGNFSSGSYWSSSVIRTSLPVMPVTYRYEIMTLNFQNGLSSTTALSLGTSSGSKMNVRAIRIEK